MDTPKPRGRYWLATSVLLVVMLLPLVLSGLGRLDPAKNLKIPLPSGGQPLGPQGSAKLQLPSLGGLTGKYLLNLGFSTPPACQDLVIQTAANQPGRPAQGQRSSACLFEITLPLGAGHSILLKNQGNSVLLLRQANLKNYTANNTGWPRFVVFLPAARLQPYPWPALLLAGLAALAALLVALRFLAGGRPNPLASGRSWLIICGPLLGCLGWLYFAAQGQRLVLPWDGLAVLVLLGPALLLLTRLARLLSAWNRRLAQKGLWQAVFDLLPAYFPFFVLFVYLPLAIYLPNQSEFDDNLYILLPFFIATLAGLGLVALLALISPPRREKITKALFLLGIFVLISDMLTPVQLGPLDGRAISDNVAEPLGFTVIQAVLLLLLILFYFKSNWGQVKKLAGYVFLIALGVQAATVAVELSPETNLSLWSDSAVHAHTPPPPIQAKGGNIYQIVLDTFTSQVFPQTTQDPTIRDYFQGFTFFPNNRSNGLHTVDSVPSFLTGSYPPPQAPGDSLDDWLLKVRQWKRGCSSGGIPKHAYDFGYTITQYMPLMRWCAHNKASRIRLASDLQKGGLFLASFADLWVLRVAPTILKKETYFKGNKGLFESLLNQPGAMEGSWWSIKQMDQMIDEERQRPGHGQYIYVHFAIPHPPCVVDENCRYVSSRWHDNPYGGFVPQAVCALRQVGRFIDELKRLGRFQRSTIIIQADHGHWSANVLDPANRTPDWLQEKLGTQRRYDNGSMALLLIKPPDAPPEPLKTDTRLTSLVDLAQTIYALNGWPVKAPRGYNVFAKDFPPGRQVAIFITTKNEQGPRYWEVLFNGRQWRINQDYPRKVR